MIDVHTHLHDAQYDGERDAVVARMRAAGVTRAITIGTSVRESRAAVALANTHDELFATVGIHPHVFNGGKERSVEWQKELGADQSEEMRYAALDVVIAELKVLVKDNKKIVAIGEVGLDYFSPINTSISNAQKSWQKQGFVAQIILSQEMGLPVVIHGRPSQGSMDAYKDILKIISAYSNIKFVMHCYMGDVAMTEKFLMLDNVVFSFAGNVTYGKKGRGGPLDEILRKIPFSRIMAETDAPYLTPVPHRGQRNESAYVVDTATYIASIYNVSVAMLSATTDTTVKSFFSLP